MPKATQGRVSEICPTKASTAQCQRFEETVAYELLLVHAMDSPMLPFATFQLGPHRHVLPWLRAVSPLRFTLTSDTLKPVVSLRRSSFQATLVWARYSTIRCTATASSNPVNLTPTQAANSPCILNPKNPARLTNPKPKPPKAPGDIFKGTEALRQSPELQEGFRVEGLRV